MIGLYADMALDAQHEADEAACFVVGDAVEVQVRRRAWRAATVVGHATRSGRHFVLVDCPHIGGRAPFLPSDVQPRRVR